MAVLAYLISILIVALSMIFIGALVALSWVGVSALRKRTDGSESAFRVARNLESIPLWRNGDIGESQSQCGTENSEGECKCQKLARCR